MSQKLINIIIFLILLIIIYRFRGLATEIKNRVVPDGLNYCLIDSDCLLVKNNGGVDCYNKKYLPAGIDSVDTSALNPSICVCSQGYCVNNYENIIK